MLLCFPYIGQAELVYCVLVVNLLPFGLGLNTSCQMPLLLWPPRYGVPFDVEPKGSVEYCLRTRVLTFVPMSVLRVL